MNTTPNGHGLMHHHHHQAPTMPPTTTPHQKQRPAGLPPTPPGSGSHSLHHHHHHPDVSMDDTAAGRAQAQGGLLPPPRKQQVTHRRSRSDVAFGYFQPLLPPPSPKMESGGWGLQASGAAATGDELFNAYMSMEGMDGLNNNSDGDSRGSSGMRTNGADSSENESEDYGGGGGGGGGADSQFLLWGDAGGASKKKRNAAGEPAAAPPPVARHARSLSMDSLMGKLSFSANGEPGKFSLEFGGGEFTPAEMKRIMADEKLAEMALADPKRVKRVLANRQSAARSKERRMRYIAELEQKVQILQAEATTLSAQLTLLQNNELKFRLQAMEQQAQLRDALNEALTTEVQRLKLGDTSSSSNMSQQMQLRCQNQMMEMQKQQGEQIPFYQLEQREQNGAPRNHDPK
ncbi:hypothetical protein HU200_018490 [Digitaria exilis]|uniref:BZIP domain-containing protein n=1 Tax=Digitaria exilis TaxID=1010633 RepID=A0A835F495_9POAL|nr:hypothetical protein HU200_018490 [Digitaria exilis]